MPKKIQTDPKVNRWDKLWQPYYNDPYFKPNRLVIETITKCFAENLNKKRILEIGAGSGCDIICLTQKGARGYALDFSSEAFKTIKYWQKRLKVKLRVIKADARNLPFPANYFDCVYSVSLVEHFINPISMLKEQLRVVKNGGYMVIDVPQKYTLYTITKHIRMYFNTHPFGWETEYSYGDLISLAKKLKQQVVHIYGRDSDVLTKLPGQGGKLWKWIVQRLEKSIVAPYVCLCIGLVLRVQK